MKLAELTKTIPDKKKSKVSLEYLKSLCERYSLELKLRSDSNKNTSYAYKTILENIEENHSLFEDFVKYYILICRAAKLMNIDIDIEFAKNVLKEQQRENRANITIDLIMDIVAKELNVKPSEVKSKSRSKNIVYARRIAIYLCRDLTTNSMPQLAQYFGMKDHTAISHTMKKINELIKNDEDFKTKIEELNNKIKSAS